MPDLRILDPVLTTVFGVICASVGAFLGWQIRGRRPHDDPAVAAEPSDDLTDDMEKAVHLSAAQYAERKGHSYYGAMAEPIAKAVVRKAMRYQQQYPGR